MSRPVCTQPGCLFKQAGFDLEVYADLLVGMLAGETNGSEVPGSKRIRRRAICKHCALRVLQGKNAYRSRDEWRALDNLGHWHEKRHWRNAHRLF